MSANIDRIDWARIASKAIIALLIGAIILLANGGVEW